MRKEKRNSMKKILSLIAILSMLILVVGCSKKSESGASFTDLTGQGSSFALPIYTAWGSIYKTAEGININYQGTGSGAGVRAMKDKTVDFAGTDVPLTVEELKEYGLVQFPTVIGGVVLAINLPEVQAGSLVLDGETTVGIFSGQITKWNDRAIASLNPGLTLPDEGITVVYRSDSSGTTSVFTSYLSAVSNYWNNNFGTGKTMSWAVGIGSKGNSGIAGTLSNNPYSIGYLEYTYAIKAELDVAQLVNKDNFPVKASVESIKNAAVYATWDESKGYATSLVNLEGENTWPIVTPTYALISLDDTVVATEAAKFFTWSFENGASLTEELYYISLPESVTEEIGNKVFKANGLSN